MGKLEIPTELEDCEDITPENCIAKIKSMSLSKVRLGIVARWCWLRHGNQNNVSAFLELLSAHKDDMLLMLENEKIQLSKLDAKITVYQGGGIKDAGFKHSWSSNRQSAKNFAMNVPFHRKPRLVVGEVEKSNVIAYFSDYDESELLINPEKVIRKSYLDDYAKTGPVNDVTTIQCHSADPNTTAQF